LQRPLGGLARKKHLIVRSGANISPIEVKAIPQDYPNVREAAVAGVTGLGQRVSALPRNAVADSIRQTAENRAVFEWRYPTV